MSAPKTSDEPICFPSVEQLDHGAWDSDRAIHEFRTFLRDSDSDGLIAVMRAFDRLNCWQRGFEQLLLSPIPDERLGTDVLSFWHEHGFHIADSLKADRIIVDVLRRFLPPYTGIGLTLYRGELELRHKESSYGISWTCNLHTARVFASRREQLEGPGVVLKMQTSPEMIVAAPTDHSHYLGEDEYVVDTRLVRAVCVIA
jgi:hypothetical protein